MTINQVNIRDPYILLYNDRYYMYGTRSETCWGVADGFDCFISYTAVVFCVGTPRGLL